MPANICCHRFFVSQGAVFLHQSVMGLLSIIQVDHKEPNIVLVQDLSGVYGYCAFLQCPSLSVMNQPTVHM